MSDKALINSNFLIKASYPISIIFFRNKDHSIVVLVLCLKNDNHEFVLVLKEMKCELYSQPIVLFSGQNRTKAK